MVRRVDNRVLRSKLRLTDLPSPRKWQFVIRMLKTTEILIFRLAQTFRIYRPRRSIIGIPSLATRNYTSLQAIVFNGTQDEVLGFRPRRLLHRLLKGLPDLETFERIHFELPVSQYSNRSVDASTEMRGFIHLQVPWQLPWRAPRAANLKMSPMGIETLVGRIRLGDYDVYSCPVFFLTEQVKWVVVSDIDDTIKESNIAKSTSLSNVLRGLFRGGYYTYEAIEGMAELYQSVVAKGGMVIYLTSTPYQLIPFLLKFLRDAGFPEGPVYPRWLGNKRFPHKWRMLHRILSNLDGQKVFLIGDSGEQDLQIYRRICDNDAFREKVEKILIRRVPGTAPPPLADRRELLYSNLSELKALLAPVLEE